MTGWFFAAVVALLAAAIIFRLWKNWVRPWREMETRVDAIRAGRPPGPYLIPGASGPRRIVRLLEEIETRMRGLEQSNAAMGAQIGTVHDAMEEGLLIVDQKARVLFANTAFQRFFGTIDSAAAPLLLEAVRDSALSQTVQAALQTARAAQGETVTTRQPVQHLALTAVPRQSAEGRADGVLVFARDISEQKTSERFRRELVANVSHQLRTPLSIFRGYIETLKDESSLTPEERARILVVMEKHSSRLQLLVEDLLNLSALESGATALHLAPVDLLSLVREMGAEWQSRFDRHRLTVEGEPELPQVTGDEVRLREAIQNLLDNAVKYSPEGGAISLEVARREDTVEVSVQDDGLGIARDDLPHIFERFYRAKRPAAPAIGGTGLGLAIVKHIAQAHGGTVAAESEPGHGTTVRLRIPLRGSVTET